jgi:hypothetical protein
MAVAILLGSILNGVRAQEAEIESSAPEAIAVEADFVWGSKYLFRGYKYTDDVTMFPAVSAEYMGLSLNYWGAIDVSGDSDFQEGDYYIDYTFSPMDLLEISAGYIYYDLPTADAGDTATQEFYLGATLDTLLSPSITGYYDFDEIDGGYIALGIGHDLEYGSYIGQEDLSISLSASLGIDFDYTSDGTGFNDILLGAELPFALNEYATIRGIAQYSIALSELDDAGGDDEFFFGGGINLAY